MAHTLRGTAGSIGAGALAQAAAALEETCRHGLSAAALAEPLATVERALATVLDGLRALDAPSEVPAPPGTPTLDHIAPLVERLKQRLSDSDASSLELLAELEPRFAGHPALRASFNRVADRIHEFDFDEALQLLQGMTFPP